MISVSELKELTKQALAAAEAAKKAKEEKDKSEFFAKQTNEINRAKQIVLGIPEICKKEAMQGKNNAKIARLEYQDYNGNFYGIGKVLDVNKLDGVGKVVWDHCVEAGLNPVLVHEHDGCGQDEWLELWVSW
jgi:hypothetical protein